MYFYVTENNASIYLYGMELNFKRGTNLMLLPVRQSPLRVLPLNCTVYHEEVSCYVKGKMGKKPKLGGQGRGADIARLNLTPIRGERSPSPNRTAQAH